MVGASGVASYTGAWIETVYDCETGLVILSHPIRVRGLKQSPCTADAVHHPSHPIRVRGLKPPKEVMFILDICRILYGCVD